MSRPKAGLIAVLILTYDSTRLLILLVEPQFGTNPSGVFPIRVQPSMATLRFLSTSGRKDCTSPLRHGLLSIAS